jgi:putative flippase GtrA
VTIEMDENSPPVANPSQSGWVLMIAQFKRFFGVGLAAFAVHYVLLIVGVELAHMPAVPASLVGYVGGGIVSYVLNRTLTFASDTPYGASMRRFIIVSGVGFGLTYVLMSLFTRTFQMPYLLAQVITTGIIMFWSFLAHKFWTFRHVANPLENVDNL